MAVYDPYDLGSATPWVRTGGTSLATPLWAGMAAIADQGRALAGGTPLGSTAMLTDLYNLAKIAPGDFHDITQGNDGHFAGRGYDLVTGLGTPKANLLIPDLAAYGLASKALILTQPPPSVAAGGQFGIIAQDATSYGALDPTYSGTATISMLSGPAGASFTPVSVPVTDGRAVFQELSLSTKGVYTFRVAMTGLASSHTNPVTVINARAGTGYFYPLPIGNSLGTDVAAADSNGFASNIIMLSISSLPYMVTGGQLVVNNGSSLKSKSFTIVGQGESSSVINAGSTSRVFEIVGTGSGLSVVFQSLAIAGGRATDGGILGSTVAMGGGLLIDGGTVALSGVAVTNNEASGAAGAVGTTGHSATRSHVTGPPGGNGGAGGNAEGGGIYLASGTLTLTNDLIQGNVAQGGAGGAGGRGGYGFTGIESSTAGNSIGPPHGANGGPGGNGAAGGNGLGGGLYLAGGTLAPLNSSVVFGDNACAAARGVLAGTAAAPGFPARTSQATEAPVGLEETARGVRSSWPAATCSSTARPTSRPMWPLAARAVAAASGAPGVMAPSQGSPPRARTAGRAAMVARAAMAARAPRGVGAAAAASISRSERRSR